MSEVKMPADGVYECGIGNHYGSVELHIKDGAASLVLDDYCGQSGADVSAEFAAAWVKQFGLSAPST